MGRAQRGGFASERRRIQRTHLHSTRSSFHRKRMRPRQPRQGKRHDLHVAGGGARVGSRGKPGEPRTARHEKARQERKTKWQRGRGIPARETWLCYERGQDGCRRDAVFCSCATGWFGLYPCDRDICWDGGKLAPRSAAEKATEGGPDFSTSHARCATLLEFRSKRKKSLPAPFNNARASSGRFEERAP